MKDAKEYYDNNRIKGDSLDKESVVKLMTGYYEMKIESTTQVNVVVAPVSLGEQSEATVCYHEHTFKKIRFGRELTKCLDCRQIIKQTEN